MIDYKQRMSDHCRVEDYILHKTNYYLWRNPYVSYRYIGKYAVFILPSRKNCHYLYNNRMLCTDRNHVLTDV